MILRDDSCTTGCTNVYTLQPVLQPVVQPVVEPVVKCIRTFKGQYALSALSARVDSCELKEPRIEQSAHWCHRHLTNTTERSRAAAMYCNLCQITLTTCYCSDSFCAMILFRHRCCINCLVTYLLVIRAGDYEHARRDALMEWPDTERSSRRDRFFVLKVIDDNYQVKPYLTLYNRTRRRKHHKGAHFTLTV